MYLEKDKVGQHIHAITNGDEENRAVQEQIDRIRKMETYFDSVQTALATSPESVCGEGPVREMLQELMRYYENGQWLEDYEYDERGLLPSELKRGVLSQDGLYNLLCGIKYMEIMKQGQG